ncbi:MAG: hypothetical protein O7G88_03150 [bacterium]|nr:hypothetical protein [bacterium]
MKPVLQPRLLVAGSLGLGLLTCGLSVDACSLACAVSLASGPLSLLEYIIVVPVAVAVMLVFVQAVRYTLWPGEQTLDHIKRRILNEDEEPV